MNAKLLFRIAMAALLLASCSSSQPLAQRDDDVYFMPSTAPPAKKAPANPLAAEERAPAPEDDYYDSGTSQDLSTNRGFYDMAYNEPHYFNYGRFGFGMGLGMMGWQSGWNGPGWGMGFGWGNDPWMNMSMGWGQPWGFSRPWGWNDPWAWNRPLGWGNPWNDPWGMGYGYGFGSYWGPMGPCLWYMPVGVSTSTTYVGHRPTMGTSISGGDGAVRQPRMATRNPIGLQPAIANHRSLDGRRRESIPGTQAIPDGRISTPTRPLILQRENHRQEPRRIIERAPSPRGTIDSHPTPGRGGLDSSPSRNGGGGSAPARRAR